MIFDQNRGSARSSGNIARSRRHRHCPAKTLGYLPARVPTPSGALLGQAPRIAGLIAGLGLVVCSSAGLLVAGLYDQRRQEMLRTVESALRAGGFDEAIQAKGSFEKEVGFPRREFESEPDLEDLRRLTTARRTALSSRSPTELQELRVAAGLAMLGLAPNSSVSVEDKRDIGTLLSFASVQRNLEFWRRSGVVTGARLLGSSDGPCAECKKLHDIVWSLDQVPEIPNPKCTSSLGC